VSGEDADTRRTADVVPYERFVARRERLARIVEELARLDDEQTLDGEVLSVAIVEADDKPDETK
jgi:hypothetical protein